MELKLRKTYENEMSENFARQNDIVQVVYRISSFIH